MSPTVPPEDRGTKRKCSRCGEWKIRDASNFIGNKECRFGLSGTCRACANAYHQAWRAKNRVKLAEQRRELYTKSEKVIEARRLKRRWREDPIRMRAMVMREGVAIRSKKIGIPADKHLLTTRYWAERLRVNTACECCGRKLRLVPIGDGKKCDASPSVDRVKPGLGYVEDNVAILCWRCNNLKRDATAQELLTVVMWMAAKAPTQETR